MEFKGTKGKWLFDKENVFTDNRLSYGNIVCIAPVEWTASNANWKPNALLISKAPEMLEMLDKIIKEHETDTKSWSTILEIKQLIKEATEL